MGDPVVPPAIPSAKKGSYFARHWRGELSLPKSYWINGVILFGIVCNMLMIIVVTIAIFALQATPSLAFGVAVVYIALTCVAYMWALVGIWRSASRYKGPAIWPILARIMIVIGVFISVGNVVKTVGAVQQVTQAHQPENLEWGR